MDYNTLLLWSMCIAIYITYPNSVVPSDDHSVGSSHSSMKANSMVCDRDTPTKSKLGM